MKAIGLINIQIYNKKGICNLFICKFLFYYSLINSYSLLPNPKSAAASTALYESDKKLTMKEIAQKIGKDKSTVTPLVNKLIRLGYIEKEKSSTDKRVTYISLTSKARDIEDRFNFISSQVKETAYKDFTKEEKEEFLRLLRKLNSNFKRT